MKNTKLNNDILITEIKSEELYAFLKFQIPATLIFIDSNSKQKSDRINLGSRLQIGDEKSITCEINDEIIVFNYDELLSKIWELMENKYTIGILINNDIFINKQPLLKLLPKINQKFITNCVSIDYNDDIFEIINLTLKNGDSDKLYYFELNDSLLGFSKNGPILIQNNPKISSIDDIVCQY